jgi:hypothetical protein
VRQVGHYPEYFFSFSHPIWKRKYLNLKTIILVISLCGHVSCCIALAAHTYWGYLKTDKSKQDRRNKKNRQSKFVSLHNIEVHGK